MTAHDDYAGLARVADALATPVAGGEYLWGIVPFRHMIEARSVDIPMIDQVRSGGITPWLKIAGMAEAFNLPVVSHGVPEIHVHLVGAVPNGLTVEYMPRLFPLWKEVPTPVDGDLADADRPRAGPRIRPGGDRQVPGLVKTPLSGSAPTRFSRIAGEGGAHAARRGRVRVSAVSISFRAASRSVLRDDDFEVFARHRPSCRRRAVELRR